MSKADDIRKMTISQIEEEIKTLKDELFRIRFEQALGTAENPSRKTQIKRTIARMKTIISEKQAAGLND